MSTYTESSNGRPAQDSAPYRVMGTPMEMPAPESRISFGPRDDDDMPASWASRGLTWLHENNPGVFGQMMLAVVGIDRKARRT
jgi:hypothetical protein